MDELTGHSAEGSRVFHLANNIRNQQDVRYNSRSGNILDAMKGYHLLNQPTGVLDEHEHENREIQLAPSTRNKPTI